MSNVSLELLVSVKLHFSAPSFQLTYPKSWTVLSKVTGGAPAVSSNADNIAIICFILTKIRFFLKISVKLPETFLKNSF